MTGTKFVYVTYIRSTLETVFDALRLPEFTTRYWVGTTHKSDWKKGSPFTVSTPDGKVWDSGEVLEIDPPRKLKMRWVHQYFPELRAEGPTIVTYELEQMGGAVKLTLTQESEVENSKVIATMSQGWPIGFANLKTLLETGEPIPDFAKPPADV